MYSPYLYFLLCPSFSVYRAQVSNADAGLNMTGNIFVSLKFSHGVLNVCNAFAINPLIY